MIDDNEQSKGYTSKLLDRFQLSSATPVTVGETELSFKTQTTVDPFLEPVSCLELLDSYRKKQIVQLKDHITYHKSYVRLMKTEIPFYLSTSDKTVDGIRAEMFDKGDYYEEIMTTTMQTILKGVSKRIGEHSTIKKRPVMLDVGGNVGWFSMLSAAHGAEVFVFEPNVVNMIRLCESSVLNGWSPSSNPENNQVHPYLKGVNDVHGIQKVMYKVDATNPGSFSFEEKHAAEGLNVVEGELQLVTLDALAQSQHWLEDKDSAIIAILKIDVEGLELKVITGAQKLLSSHKIQYIFLEWKVDQVERWGAMATILLDAGYVLYKFGGWMGPENFVTTDNKMQNNVTELVNNLAQIAVDGKWDGANVLFRLASIVDMW
jgi:FkbM family methyltransferase